jgi:hypothetical protein
LASIQNEVLKLKGQLISDFVVTKKEDPTSKPIKKFSHHANHPQKNQHSTSTPIPSKKKQQASTAPSVW